jgi:hypothetical protein
MENKRDIDKIIEAVKTKFPNVTIEQLKVMHSADDNGLWYFSFEKFKDEIQIESSSGICPFLIESNRSDKRVYGNSVDEVVNIICEHLRTSKYNK